VAGNSEWRWLESTRKLQETSFGVDFSQRETGAKLADNLVHQGFALIIELAEAFGEIQWKDWAENRGQYNREAVVGELVDVGHFLANLLVHFNVTDDEWEGLYQAKQDRNRMRQATAGGYNAKASKCLRCHRELDKPKALIRMVVMMSPSTGNTMAVIRCTGCSQRLGVQMPGEEITWDKGVSIPGLSPESFTDG
jgi:hypothetical protein